MDIMFNKSLKLLLRKQLSKEFKESKVSINNPFRRCYNCKFLYANSDISKCNKLNILVSTDLNDKTYCYQYTQWIYAIE